MRLPLILALGYFAFSSIRADVSPARPLDCSTIRGVNYCAAAGHHDEHWLNYDPKVTERDLDYARRININQVRVFLSRRAYMENKEAFRQNLVNLAKACQARNIGLMPVLSGGSEILAEGAPYPLARAWVQDLIKFIGQEPALVCWDVYNEPDYPESPKRAARVADARVMASLFRELDTGIPRTPVTIGFAFEKFMEQNEDAVDVLSFHDYSATRDDIRQNIDSAVAFAAKAKKSVLNSEIGCTARANPYDVTIEEYSKAHVGFYIWELMITKYWGNVHGVFYEDGTVRDPSIAAAMLGFYRNRSEQIVQEFPDREGAVTRAVTSGRKWLGDPSASYESGLTIAETAANLLEANELVAMRDLPTRRVAILRKGKQDRGPLSELLNGLLNQLEPYQHKQPTT